MLAGKRIVLGVAGGIAAYKSAELARLLVKAGAAVQVVMTRSATRFVGPLTFQALTGSPVWLDETASEDAMPHIRLGRHQDLILVAPATADLIARLAQGRADDLLAQTCLARECPLWVAPAMNQQMWRHPATQRNLQWLRDDGVRIVGPAEGEQACGETGPGRMTEPQDIVQELLASMQAGVLAGRRVLVTAGPTIERIDPVRALTNFSSGRMGYAVAQAAVEAGARVTLVSGPTCLQAPAGPDMVRVESASDMFAAVMERVNDCDIFISVAAVADFRPAMTSAEKIKKDAAPASIALLPNADILAHVAALPAPPFCVGFAAETSRLAEHGEAKRRAKRLPLLVVNQARLALGSPDNELLLLDDRGEHLLARTDKLSAARQLIAHIAQMLRKH